MSYFNLGLLVAFFTIFVFVLYPMIRNGYSKVQNVAQSAAATNTAAGAAPAPVPKPAGAKSKLLGKIGVMTFIGIIAFTMILIIFMLIPGDIVAYVGTILMTILMIMIITSIVMLVTGWGSRLVWIPLLVGFIWLSYNPPETTAQQVAKTTATIAKGGLQTVAPDLVPNFIFETPAEARARIVAQAELDKLTAEGEARTRVAAENAAARAQDESMINANAVPCVRGYTKQLNCTQVTFGVNTKYDRTALYDEAANGLPAKSYCIIADPGEPTVTRKDLGGGQHRYTGTSGLVVQFFDAPEGSFHCGS